MKMNHIKNILKTITFGVVMGVAPLAMAAGSTNPSAGFDFFGGGLGGNSTYFEELVKANRGLERVQPLKYTMYQSAALNNSATGAIDPATGLLVTPVTGIVGNSKTFRVMSASTNRALTKPITVTHRFKVTTTTPGFNSYPVDFETIATLNRAPVIVLVTAVHDYSQMSVAKAKSQLRVTVVNPKNGRILNSRLYRSSRALGGLDPLSAKIVDANGDGSDDLVLQYRKDLKFVPGLKTMTSVNQVRTVVLSLKNGRVIKQYIGNESWVSATR